MSHHPLVTGAAGIIFTLVLVLKWLRPAAPSTVGLDPLAILEGEGDAGLQVTAAIVLDIPYEHCCWKASVLKGETEF